jgi:hypothetical protein
MYCIGWDLAQGFSGQIFSGPGDIKQKMVAGGVVEKKEVGIHVAAHYV